MQSNTGRRIKHVLAFILLVVIITLNLDHMADRSTAPLDSGWTIQANDAGVGYSTFGQQNSVQQFGIIQQHGRCDQPQLLLTIASVQDNFEDFVGQTVKLHIQMGEHAGVIEVPVIDVVQITASTQVAVLSNFVLNQRWLDDLSSEDSLSVEILSPDDFYLSLEQTSEVFRLSGYNAMSSLANLRCETKLKRSARTYLGVDSIFTNTIFMSA